MKIPTVFEIERAEGGRSGMPRENIQQSHEGYEVKTMPMGIPHEQMMRGGAGGSFNYAHQKSSSIPGGGFPSVKGLISISEGVNEPEGVAY